jgi:hypothetical protein
MSGYKGAQKQSGLPHSLVNLNEAAKFLNVPPNTLCNWIYKNKYPVLKSFRIGIHLKFTVENLIEFVKSQEVERPINPKIPGKEGIR